MVQELRRLDRIETDTTSQDCIAAAVVGRVCVVLSQIQNYCRDVAADSSNL
jgi:hypothetical protein